MSVSCAQSAPQIAHTSLGSRSCCSKINEARDKGVKDTYCQDSQGKRFDWQLKQDGYYWCPTREG